MLRSSLLGLLLLPLGCLAQGTLVFDPDVPVQRDGTPLPMAWAGGLNFPQFSPIDLNNDGLQDLFALDRSGNKPLFFLNVGTAGEPSYVPTHAYDLVQPFPLLHDWALLRDYNCDGKADIFAYTSGAFAVYRNTSDASGLSFTLTDDMVGSNYVPTQSPNLFITNVDIPGITDVDGDGDLDVITFSIWGANYLEYHKNLSMEQYGNCDSLIYEVRSRCWGNFVESIEGNTLTLDQPCSDNVPNPEAPPHPGTGIPADANERAHTGSTVLPLDLDGDGDMDLILGDYASPDLMALTNGGSTSHAQMTAVDTLFPWYDQQAYFQQFLAAYHVDVDQDGKRDLIVAPNANAAAEDAHGIWYYHNTGTDGAPVFHFERNDLFQGDMMEFGEGAWPVLFDHNGDDLMDLVVANEGYWQEDGTYKSELALLENTGTAQQPSFDLVTGDYMGLSALGLGPGLYPAFGDLDGDGRPDMVLGDLAGSLHFLHNTAAGPVAEFTQAPVALQDDAGNAIDVGQDATPQLVDLDGDGLLDLLVGERNGNINYFHNIGTAQAPTWHLVTETLGGVSVNEYWSQVGFSTPFLYTDDQGQKAFLSGSESGWLHHYSGISADANTPWNLTDSTWQDLYEGWRTSAVLHDFNGDGLLDAVVGNYRGGLSFWSSGPLAGMQALPVLAPNAFTLAPNPADGQVELCLHRPWTDGLKATVMDELGRTVRTSRVQAPSVQIDCRNLPAGLYLVQLTDGHHSWSRRLLIAH